MREMRVLRNGVLDTSGTQNNLLICSSTPTDVLIDSGYAMLKGSIKERHQLGLEHYALFYRPFYGIIKILPGQSIGPKNIIFMKYKVPTPLRLPHWFYRIFLNPSAWKFFV